MPDGSLLVVSMREHQVLRRWPDGKLTTHADISRYATGHANDMVVDKDGRAYIGNTGGEFWSDPPTPRVPAHVVMVTPEGKGAISDRHYLSWGTLKTREDALRDRLPEQVFYLPALLLLLIVILLQRRRQTKPAF